MSWRQVLSNNLSTSNFSDYEEVIEFFELRLKSHLKNVNFNKKTYTTPSFGRGTSYTVRHRDGSVESYDLSELIFSDRSPELSLKFNVRQLLSGESLADNSLSYESTSAQFYKPRKLSIQKEAATKDKAIKIINNFFSKL